MGVVQMNLAQCKEGQEVIILKSKNSQIHVQALRFGINEGSLVKIAKNIAGGPIIILKNQLEIAIGRQIAVGIEVESI